MIKVNDIPVTVNIPGADFQSFKYKRSYKDLQQLFKKYNVEDLYDKIYYTARIADIEYINADSVESLSKDDLFFLYRAFDNYQESKMQDKEMNSIDKRQHMANTAQLINKNLKR